MAYVVGQTADTGDPTHPAVTPPTHLYSILLFKGMVDVFWTVSSRSPMKKLFSSGDRLRGREEARRGGASNSTAVARPSRTETERLNTLTGLPCTKAASSLLCDSS